MILEKEINDFFNNFFKCHHKINNLLFDNLDIYYNICIFLEQELSIFFENNEFEYDLDGFTKKSFYENIELIKNFYIKYKIDFNLDRLVFDGTVEFKEIEFNDYSFSGYNNIVDDHKSVTLYNNGLIIDSVILVHELSHLSNQSNKERTQVNNLITEAVAFAYEFIYLDYLFKEGYQDDSFIFRYSLMKTFYQILTMAYPLLRLYYVYDKTGKISEENYKFVFNYSDDYEEVLKEFYEIISEDENEIFEVLWYIVALYLSIYMYISYKKNNNFLNKIKLLNDNLNEISLEKALKIINLECIYNDFYTKDNVNKIKESFELFKNEFKNLKDISKKK